MAKEVQSKKRKASVPEAEAAQLKKVKKLTTETAKAPEKKRKATEDATPVAVKKTKKPKPVTADEPASKPAKKDNAEAVATKPQKASKDTTSAAAKVNGAKDKTEAKPKEAKESKPTKDISSDNKDDEESGASDDDSDSEIDDQTVALLKGFESDGDEEDAQKEEGLPEGKEVPKVPELSKKNKKAIKRAAESGEPEKPGVIYVGHIPHGFYEHEMRAYFEQFGNILQLRLSRNRKTGASKHYAFIKFESASVADIVAKTMDNYLLFNHILKVKLIPDEQVPADLFKGANKRFKKIPWNKIAGRKLAQGASEATWEKRIEKEEKRRAEKAEKMKKLGYEFDAPKIKSAQNVAKKTEPALVLNVEEDETKAIEAAPVVEESSKSEKKEKKSKAIKDTEAVAESSSAPIEESSKPEKKEKKDKKSKKSESAAATETPATSTADVPEKKLKTKKSRTSLADATTVGSDASQEKTKKSKKNKA